MPNYRIPNLVKHCCIAIYREGGISARSAKDKFKQCLLIARSRMAQYGFIVLTGEKLTDPIALTPKGRAAELRHKREGRAKTGLFDALYEQFDIDGTKAAAEAAAKKAQEATAAKVAEAQEAAKAAKKAGKKK